MSNSPLPQGDMPPVDLPSALSAVDIVLAKIVLAQGKLDDARDFLVGLHPIEQNTQTAFESLYLAGNAVVAAVHATFLLMAGENLGRYNLDAAYNPMPAPEPSPAAFNDEAKGGA